MDGEEIPTEELMTFSTVGAIVDHVHSSMSAFGGDPSAAGAYLRLVEWLVKTIQEANAAASNPAQIRKESIMPTSSLESILSGHSLSLKELKKSAEKEFLGNGGGGKRSLTADQCAPLTTLAQLAIAIDEGGVVREVFTPFFEFVHTQCFTLLYTLLLFTTFW